MTYSWHTFRFYIVNAANSDTSVTVFVHTEVLSGFLLGSAIQVRLVDHKEVRKRLTIAGRIELIRRLW
jgi:hypothetical protein